MVRLHGNIPNILLVAESTNQCNISIATKLMQ